MPRFYRQVAGLGLLQSKCLRLHPPMAMAMCGHGSCSSHKGGNFSKFFMDYRLCYLCIVQCVRLLGGNQTLLPKNIEEIFEHCYFDLMELAQEWHTSYAIVNLLIYVILFIAIMAFDISLIMLML